MKARKDTPKERQRLLRFLAARPARLNLPLSNEALLGMLRDGLIIVSHRWNEQMASGDWIYQCVELTITDEGRKAVK